MPGAPIDDSSVEVCVLGAGSWGTALAIHAARKGHRVRLWTRKPEHARDMERDGENLRYLPGHTLGGVRPTADMSQALRAARLVIVAIPSHGIRAAMRGARPALDDADSASLVAPAFLIAAKGVEVDSLASMEQVLVEELPENCSGRIAALGGPSFAAEVAGGKPTTVVIGCRDADLAAWMQEVLSGPKLRVYTTDDIVGVELGGAFKNVVALAAGMVDGAGLGLNARAGLITRGLHEIGRLAEKMGAHPATLSGLAGLGDLVLTCTGGLSRNRRVGVALGEGRQLEAVLGEMGMVAEGVRNALSAHQLANAHGVEMPIVETVHAILYEGLDVRTAVEGLMGRGLKAERH
jgi:glycerol-3-phosphate dehydrogenase (NAD(P)+)